MIGYGNYRIARQHKPITSRQRGTGASARHNAKWRL